VVGPGYVDVGVSANLALRDDAPPEPALEDARRRLAAFLHPLQRWRGRKRWPFGQNVYASEVYSVARAVGARRLRGKVQLTGPAPVPGPDGPAVGVELDANQLVRLARVDLTGYDTYGRSHPLSWTAGS